MASRAVQHLRANWVAWVAVGLIVAGGSSAYALRGKNKVFSDDIKNGAVKLKDLAPKARPKPSPVRSISYSGRNTDAETARHRLVMANGVTLSARCDTSFHNGVTVYLFARNGGSGSVRIGDSFIEDIGLSAQSGAETVTVAAGAEKIIDADESTDLHLTGSDDNFTVSAQGQLAIRRGATVAIVDLHVFSNGLVEPAACEMFGAATLG